MKIQIGSKCHECGRLIKLIYHTDRDEVEPEELFGCPGDECKQIHEFTIKQIDEEEVKNIRDQDYSW